MGSYVTGLLVATHCLDCYSAMIFAVMHEDSKLRIVEPALLLTLKQLQLASSSVVMIRNIKELIRERGSVLYLGMAKEISKYHTDAPAGKRPKKLLPPKPSMQRE